MKTIWTLLILLAVGTVTSAQTHFFTLNETGFIDSKNNNADHIVIEVPDKSKSDLYNKSLLYFTSIYKSPQDVISKIDNEALTINGIARNSIKRNSIHVFDNNYSLNLLFKDGKIRIGAPAFKLTTIAGGKFQTLYLVANNSLDGSNLGIYNKKGKLNSEKAKEDLEKFFNTFINEYIVNINKENNW